MISLERLGGDVFVARGPIVCFGDEELAFLRQQAARSPRRRARICAHRANEDALHEMIIAITAESYIHPHMHVGKSESLHIVEGGVDVIIFNDAGGITDLVALGAPDSGRSFFYRMSESRYHTLLIRTGMLIVHEVTNGPFDRGQTVLAPFAPREEDREAARTYTTLLAEEVSRHLRSVR